MKWSCIEVAVLELDEGSSRGQIDVRTIGIYFIQAEVRYVLYGVFPVKPHELILIYKPQRAMRIDCHILQVRQTMASLVSPILGMENFVKTDPW